MKNTFGNQLTVTLFGESHGNVIGAVLDGISPGIMIDHDYIQKKLALRRPFGKISTSRVERDAYTLVSGVFNGKTTGAPLTVLIPNENKKSDDYATHPLRPGHADLAAMLKYQGYEDYRGGGHFSGRLTAPLVVIGAILEMALADKGIVIGTHIKRLAGIDDLPLNDLENELPALNEKRFATLSDEIGAQMIAAIEEAAEEGDSVGGILETAVTGLPAGLGEPWFDSVESLLSHALFSIGGVKGVAFGDGFALSDMRGSEANDPLSVQDGRIVTLTNKNGGINGGITNGMPLRFTTAVKPTPSIFKEQQSVSPDTMTPYALSLKGRHDPAIVHRIRAVVDAMTAIVLADLLTTVYGRNYFLPHKESV